MPYYVIWCFDILLLELLRCEKKKNGKPIVWKKWKWESLKYRQICLLTVALKYFFLSFSLGSSRLSLRLALLCSNKPKPPRESQTKKKKVRDSEMDLDQWISKVKDGQHLLEDELQLLCEYVRISLLFFSQF